MIKKTVCSICFFTSLISVGVSASPINKTSTELDTSAGKKLSQVNTIIGFDKTRSTELDDNLKSDIVRPVQQLFDGMREHNQAKIMAAFAPKASLIRASHSGVLKYTDVSQFAQSITKRKKDIMDERIIRYQIQHFENLATVWTYFVFYFNGKISHCGVNTIQVVNADNQWRIGSLMDTAYQGSCEEFILDYRMND